MEDYQKEYWVSLYHSALIELEQAKISGRIIAAQKSIAARVEKLRNIPGLHTEEYRSIDEALRTLGFLEAEDASFDAEAERRAVEETLKKLRSVGPTIQRLKENSDPD
jgi:hypothetical protein